MLSIYKNFIITSFIVLFVSVNGISQVVQFDKEEHIELLTDRLYYVSGETIWYTAYYSMDKDYPETLSKIMYVELFDNNLRVVASQKVEIHDGLANGKILISEQSITGYYILRAYTRYQENKPISQMATVVLSIVNPSHPLPAIQSTDANNIVSYAKLPNGSLAFGISRLMRNRVESINLLVNNEIIGVRPRYFSNGIGSFDYKMKQDAEVKLQIGLNNGDTIISKAFTPEKSYPHITSSGTTDGILFNITNNTFLDEELFFYVNDIYGNDLFSGKVEIANGVGRAMLPHKKVPSNVYSIVLHDKDNNQIGSSHHYIPSCAKKVGNDQKRKAVSPNSKISYNIGNIEDSEFPISVSFVLDGTGSNYTGIIPDFLINNPQLISTYFGNDCIDSSTFHQIEIALALTKEVVFNKIIENNRATESSIAEFVGLTLQGSLVSNVSSETIIDELVYCSVLGDMPQFHTARTLANGKFVVPLINYSGIKDVYIGIDESKKGEDIEIVIENGFCKEPPIWFSTYFSPDSSTRDLITQMYFNHQVISEFDVNNEQTIENENRIRPIFGDNLKEILLADYVQLNSVPEIINEIVPYVRARKKDGNFNLIVLDDQLNIKYENPLLFVDQIPYYNINALMELQPTEIEYIEVAAHKYMYGNEQFNGILSVSTNTRNFAGLPLSENGVFAEYKGIEDEVSFVPVKLSPDDESIPNYSNTVFWNTIVDKNEMNEVAIYTPSNIGKYNLVIYSFSKKKKIDSKQIQIE